MRTHPPSSLLCSPSSGLLCTQGLSFLMNTVCIWPSRPFSPFCPCPLVSSSPYHMPRFPNPSINAQETSCLIGLIIFSGLARAGAAPAGRPWSGWVPGRGGTLPAVCIAHEAECRCSEGPGASSVYRTEAEPEPARGPRRDQQRCRKKTREDKT